MEGVQDGASIKVLLLGATGEVGKEVLNSLAEHKGIKSITVIGRRKLQLPEDKYKNVEQQIVDFDKLDDFKEAFNGFDAGYCCLGTTKGKSGTEGFIKVDRDYVVNSARLAKQGGCKQFHLVTSQGANKSSWFLYPRTKGEAEEMVTQLGFERLCIYRPALLLCDRQVTGNVIDHVHQCQYFA